MGHSKEFKHDTRQDVADIAAYLKGLADGFEAGTITMNSDVDQVILKPTGVVDLEVKTKSDEEKGKMEIKLKWNENRDKPLHIGSKVE